MKQFTVLLCSFLVFASCKKTAENLPDNTTAAVQQEDANAATRIYAFDVSKQSWGITGKAKLNYYSTDGNPGGFIIGADQSYLDSDLNHWYFLAPPRFLESIRNITGLNHTLKFDLTLKVPDGVFEPGSSSIVCVSCPSFQMFRKDDDIGPVLYSWTTLQIPFNSGWYIVEGGVERLATARELKTAWTGITELKILGDWAIGFERCGLDNITVE